MNIEIGFEAAWGSAGAIAGGVAGWMVQRYQVRNLLRRVRELEEAHDASREVHADLGKELALLKEVLVGASGKNGQRAELTQLATRLRELLEDPPWYHAMNDMSGRLARTELELRDRLAELAERLAALDHRGRRER